MKTKSLQVDRKRTKKEKKRERSRIPPVRECLSLAYRILIIFFGIRNSFRLKGDIAPEAEVKVVEMRYGVQMGEGESVKGKRWGSGKGKGGRLVVCIYVCM